jgi:hypothetical protein
MEQLHDTREGWLSHGMVLAARRFRDAGYSLPDNLKVACGFAPGARGGKALGVCISPKASADGRTEMFISPVISEAITALGVLVHEMAHAAVGVEAGHGPAFKACASRVGLEGKATSAMPGSGLNAWLASEVLPMLGTYPHAAVDPNARKKQGTRMIKLVCPETGYTVRTTKKWLEQGYPTSPAGCEMVPVGEDEGEGE